MRGPKERLKHLAEEREHFLKYLQRLNSQVQSGEMAPRERIFLLELKTKGIPPNIYLDRLNNQVLHASRHDATRTKVVRHASIAAGLFLFLAMFFYAFINPTLTGLVSMGGEQEYVLNINQNYTNGTTEYYFNVLDIANNTNNLTSLRITGKYTGQLVMKLISEIDGVASEYVVYESSTPEDSGNMITGYAVKESKGTIKINETMEFNDTIETNETIDGPIDEDEQEISVPEGDIDDSIDITEPELNITEPEMNITEPEMNDTANGTGLIEEFIIPFTTLTDECIETCKIDISPGNLSILIEVIGGEFYLEKILFTQEKFNHAPLQIKNIPDIYGMTEINLSEYFYDPEGEKLSYDFMGNYYVHYELDELDGETLNISTDSEAPQEFYIYATDGEKVTTSNKFMVYKETALPSMPPIAGENYVRYAEDALNRLPDQAKLSGQQGKNLNVAATRKSIVRYVDVYTDEITLENFKKRIRYASPVNAVNGSSILPLAFSKLPEIVQIEFDNGEKLDATIGGDNAFEPKLSMGRWDKEARMDITLDANDPVSYETYNNTVNLNYSGYRIGLRTITKENVGDIGMEFDIVLDSLPSTNVFDFSIDSENLSFYYQPPLDEELGNSSCNATDCEGRHRPENVVGSYAVYHSSKRNNEYQTGKAFHIYRPLVYDSINQTTWADMHIDSESGTMTLTVLQEFLDDASYPVMIDPPIVGYTGQGSSTQILADNDGSGASNNYRAGNDYTGVNATLTSISAYLEADANYSVKGLVNLRDDPDANTHSVVGSGEITGVDAEDAWRTVTLNNAAVSSDNVYVLNFIGSGDSIYKAGVPTSIRLYYDSNSQNVYGDEKTNMDYSGTEDPWEWTPKTDTYQYSMYFTYSTPAPIQLPNVTSFNGASTNFTGWNTTQLENASNVTLENISIGKIKWTKVINVSGADFDNKVKMGYGWIFVNTSGMHASINSSANLTIYNVPEPNVRILRDGLPCTTCRLISYSGGNLTFNVTGFSNYSLTMNITLISPNNGNFSVVPPVTFISDIADNYGIVNASLYTNESGSWVSRETRWNGEVPRNSTDLIALYHLNNESVFGENDTYIIDWSGNGINLSCGDTCPAYASGKFSSGVYKKPTDNPFSAPDSDDFTGWNAMTVMAWVNPARNQSAQGGSGNILTKRHDGTGETYNSFYLIVHTNNGVVFHVLNETADGPEYAFGTANSAIAGRWTMIVGRYNGTNVDTFVNGVEDTIDEYALVGRIFDSNRELHLGFEDFNGSIDEVALWNRSLSNAEILALYNYSRTKFYPVFQRRDYDALRNITWNVLGMDNQSDYSWAPNNFTFYTSGNNAPVMKSSSILPYPSYANESLRGYCNATDEENVSYYYKWFNGGVLNKTGNTSFLTPGFYNIDNISYSLLAHDQTWVFECMATDGSLNSTALNSSQTYVYNHTIALISPFNGNYSVRSPVFFTSYAVDFYNIINASLYTNESGSWISRETRWNGEVPWNSTGLIALYHFNNESAFGENDSLARDWTGLNPNASCTECPVFNSSGMFGGAFRYDNQSTEFTLGTGLSTRSNFTLSLWVYRFAGTNTTIAGLFLKDNQWWIGLDVDNIIHFKIDQSPWTEISGPAVIQSERWYNIVVTHNSTNHSTIYINGTMDETGTLNIPNNPSGIVYVGSVDDDNYHFGGLIDELAFWNRTLSASEVMALYNYSATKFYPVFQNRTLPAGAYTWNVQTYNNISNYDWATNNFTFKIFSLPVISNLSINTSIGTNYSNENLLLHFTQSDASGNTVYNNTDWRLNGTSIAYLNMPFNYNYSYVKDYSTRGNNGTKHGDPQFVDGIVGGGYRFNTTNYINISSSSSTNMYDNFTMMFWINTSGNDGCIIGRSSGQGSQGIFIDLASNKIRVRVYNATGGLLEKNSTATLQNNTWYHVGVYRQLPSTTLWMFIDGVYHTSLANIGDINIKGDILIGKCNGSGINATVDDIIISNKYLSSIYLIKNSMPTLWRVYGYTETQHGEIYKACVTASNVNGETSSCSNNITIRNSVPVIAANNILPAIAYVNDTLRGMCYTSDVDDDQLIYYYKWFLNGVFNNSGVSGYYPAGITANINNVSVPLNKGQNWTLECIANDGEFNSSTLNSTPNIIQDAVPSVSNVVLSSTSGYNQPIDNLTVTFIQADIDGDTVYNVTDWRRNGTSIAVLNMPFNINISSNASHAVRDYSTFENNGTLGGGNLSKTAAWVTTGKIGGGYYFNGTSMIKIYRTPSIEPASHITMEAWINPSIASHSSEVLLIKSGSYSLILDSNEYPTCGISTSLANSALYSSPITENAWTHIACTFNGTHILIYTNGVLRDTKTHISPGTINYYSWANLTIGYDNTFNYYEGIIDEVKIYNITLTPEQINQSYQAGLANLSLQRILSQEIIKHDIWQVAVTPTTKFNEGTTILSNSINISGYVPVMNSSVILPSTAYRNESLRGYCNATDADLDNIKYNYKWFLNGVLNVSGNTSSGAQAITVNVANISSSQLAIGQNWTLQCMAEDALANSTAINSTVVNIQSRIPEKVSLRRPTNMNYTMHDRKPLFEWDSTNYTTQYQINITSSTGCGGNYYQNITFPTLNFTPSNELCAESEGPNTHYDWRVRACGDDACGNWSNMWNFSIEPYVVITIVNNTINFSSLLLGETKNTTQGNPGPFVLRNDGNVRADLINASSEQSLWTSVGLNTLYYRVKTRESEETNSFNLTSSITNWVNVGTSNISLIQQLNYSDSSDSAYVDIQITVPGDEPSGPKQSSIIFSWEQSP